MVLLNYGIKLNGLLCPSAPPQLRGAMLQLLVFSFFD